MSEPSALPIRRTFIAADDVAVSSLWPTANYARRFTLDVAEEALARMAPAAIEHLTLQLAERIVYENQSAIEMAVSDLLTDRTWAEPIIRQALREAVHKHVADMFDGSGLM